MITVLTTSELEKNWFEDLSGSSPLVKIYKQRRINSYAK